MPYCEKCGNRISENSKFCSGCGIAWQIIKINKRIKTPGTTHYDVPGNFILHCYNKTYAFALTGIYGNLEFMLVNYGFSNGKSKTISACGTVS